MLNWSQLASKLLEFNQLFEASGYQTKIAMTTKIRIFLTISPFCEGGILTR